MMSPKAKFPDVEEVDEQQLIGRLLQTLEENRIRLDAGHRERQQLELERQQLREEQQRFQHEHEVCKTKGLVSNLIKDMAQ